MRFKTMLLGLILPLLFACGADGAIPDGAYLRSEFTGGYLSNVVYVFRGGRVAYAAQGDLEAFDFDAHAAAAPKNAGRYVRNGNSLRIEWGDGSVQEGELRADRTGGGFQFYGAPFAPIQRIDDPSRLKGRYYGGASYGGVSNSFDLRFDGHGGFQSSSTGSVASTSSASEISATSSRDGGGRYALSGTRLTLGSEQHWAYEVPTDNAAVVEMLIVDGVVMTRED
jgi:hypothetical protein